MRCVGAVGLRCVALGMNNIGCSWLSALQLLRIESLEANGDILSIFSKHFKFDRPTKECPLKSRHKVGRRGHRRGEGRRRRQILQAFPFACPFGRCSGKVGVRIVGPGLRRSIYRFMYPSQPRFKLDITFLVILVHCPGPGANCVLSSFGSACGC